VSDHPGAPDGLDPEAFRAAFGVGAPGAKIHPVDGLGVALTGIQGLRELVEEHADGLEELRRRLTTLEHSTHRA
jgi:hypothetical protein